jgi:hypothetical protein
MTSSFHPFPKFCLRKLSIWATKINEHREALLSLEIKYKKNNKPELGASSKIVRNNNLFVTAE